MLHETAMDVQHKLQKRVEMKQWLLKAFPATGEFLIL
jgi:hypothetical protein